VINLFSIVSLAAATFLATNVDNLVLLFAFLANRSFRTRNVIVGYGFGMLAILALSWIAGLLADLIHPHYVGFLGFVPIGLGLKQLYDQFVRHKASSDPVLVERSKRSQIATVAVADVSHGPDTIILFSVLLVEGDNLSQFAISLTYIVLVFVWCSVGLFLFQRPLLREPIQRYGHRLSPYLLIGIGVYILSDTISGLRL
jgi:cadmium resistance protein CadD (predicted permease)